MLESQALMGGSKSGTQVSRQNSKRSQNSVEMEGGSDDMEIPSDDEGGVEEEGINVSSSMITSSFKSSSR